MAFEEFKENLEDVQENAKAYIERSVEYYKLLGFKIAMKSTTLALKFFLIAFCLLLFIIFGSVAGSLALGKFLGSYPLGFLCVSGFYLVLALLLFLFRNKIIDKPILEKFSEIFFND
jgi:hypothetical protein